MSTPEPATGPLFIPDLMDYLKNGTDPAAMAEAELAAAVIRDSGLVPGTYTWAKAHMDAEDAARTPRRPVQGEHAPVTMIFRRMGLTDENGVAAPPESEDHHG